uniref:Corepressor interacting with RBPJ 1-like n=1 Tax=Crassostrea virginica TaxID=6565 RepID=A0A8B8BJ31_CRAVI|nr:corepressor interacting with RBPJ 1-like [Crassostrea virginica]
MGKGFNNYMTKKFFHPGSKDNIKRVWMAQQKTNYEKQKQDDLLSQYQKEQEMYKNRALLGDEKAKLGLSFMYDAPPGLKKKEVEEKETEVKFEWQRKYNAPRENYLAKDDETIRDQPFGIEVRNVRCIKCRKWGHVNTDRICPLFNQDLTAEPPQPSTSASSLLEGLQSDGFTLKKSILGKMGDNADTEKLLESEDEDDPEVQFLKSLNPKQRKKLLKKLNKLQSGKTDGRVSKEKKKKKKKHKKRSGSSDEDSESETKSHHRKRRASSSEASDNEHKRHSVIESSPRKDQRSKRGESPRSRGHSSNLKQPSRPRRSDSFERSRVQENSLGGRGNRERNRRSRSPNPRERSRSPNPRERRTADVGKGKHRSMRRSRSSSSDTDGASHRRPQRPRSRSTERGERPRRRSDSRERNNYSSRQRRSHSRERRRSRSRDRRRRSDS